MKNTYEKPKITLTVSMPETVYMASGDVTIGTTASSKSGCNSKYMNGVYKAPNYSDTSSYIMRFGCLGCPAFRYNGCGLELEEYWGSYDVDNGKRYPSWEKIGHAPNDPINWDDVGL